MKQSASILIRAGRTFVSTFSQADNLLWIADGVPEVAGNEPSAAELGAVVSKALAASRAGLPFPTSRGRLLLPLLRLANVSTEKELNVGARSVSVKRDAGQTVVYPMVRRGREFHYLPDQAIVLESPSTEDLGRAVLNAIERSS